MLTAVIESAIRTAYIVGDAKKTAFISKVVVKVSLKEFLSIAIAGKVKDRKEITNNFNNLDLFIKMIISVIIIPFCRIPIYFLKLQEIT